MFPEVFSTEKYTGCSCAQSSFWSRSVFFVWDFICYFVVVLIRKTLKKKKIPKDFFYIKVQVSSSFWAVWSSAESLASSWQPQAGAEGHVAASWGKSMLWGHFRRHAAQVVAYLDLHSQAAPAVVFSLSHQLREGKVSQWVSELNMGVRASRWQGSCDNRSWKCPIFMKPEFNSMKWPTKVMLCSQHQRWLQRLEEVLSCFLAKTNAACFRLLFGLSPDLSTLSFVAQRNQISSCWTIFVSNEWLPALYSGGMVL